MSKQTIEVPVLSQGVRDVGVPLSLVTKANGFVFVSGTPPFDLETGKFVRGDIEVQTEASLKAVQHCLESAGTSLDKVVMVRVYASNAGSIKRSIGSTLASFRRTHPRAPSCRSLRGRWNSTSRSNASPWLRSLW
jgi:enamine deaminase RidA (YjgF/YER057c/UK114 family)